MRIINVSKEGGIPAIAIPDLRGAGDAQKFMAAFNETLSSDVKVFRPFQDSSPRHRSPPSSRSSPPISSSPRRRQRRPHPWTQTAAQPATPPNGGGRWMQDWSSPPAQANFLAFGYTAAQNGVLVLQGWLYDLAKDTPR